MTLKKQRNATAHKEKETEHRTGETARGKEMKER